MKVIYIIPAVIVAVILLIIIVNIIDKIVHYVKVSNWKDEQRRKDEKRKVWFADFKTRLKNEQKKFTRPFSTGDLEDSAVELLIVLIVAGQDGLSESELRDVLVDPTDPLSLPQYQRDLKKLSEFPYQINLVDGLVYVSNDGRDYLLDHAGTQKTPRRNTE